MSIKQIVSPHSIIDFWFNEIEPKHWWQKSAEFDEKIRERFLATHNAARQCELYSWRSEPLGRLAEIIVLDQFSRNIYRDHPQAFANDPMAITLTQEAISIKADRTLHTNEKSFLYMPLMHSESALLHKLAVTLFSQPGLESNYDFELKHKAIIDRFGRYPHRNEILGRQSTDEETAFLQEPGSSF